MRVSSSDIVVDVCSHQEDGADAFNVHGKSDDDAKEVNEEKGQETQSACLSLFIQALSPRRGPDFSPAVFSYADTHAFSSMSPHDPLVIPVQLSSAIDSFKPLPEVSNCAPLTERTSISTCITDQREKAKWTQNCGFGDRCRAAAVTASSTCVNGPLNAEEKHTDKAGSNWIDPLQSALFPAYSSRSCLGRMCTSPCFGLCLRGFIAFFHTLFFFIFLIFEEGVLFSTLWTQILANIYLCTILLFSVAYYKRPHLEPQTSGSSSTSTTPRAQMTAEHITQQVCSPQPRPLLPAEVLKFSKEAVFSEGKGSDCLSLVADGIAYDRNVRLHGVPLQDLVLKSMPTFSTKHLWHGSDIFKLPKVEALTVDTDRNHRRKRACAIGFPPTIVAGSSIMNWHYTHETSKKMSEPEQSCADISKLGGNRIDVTSPYRAFPGRAVHILEALVALVFPGVALHALSLYCIVIPLSLTCTWLEVWTISFAMLACFAVGATSRVPLKIGFAWIPVLSGSLYIMCSFLQLRIRTPLVDSKQPQLEDARGTSVSDAVMTGTTSIHPYATSTWATIHPGFSALNTSTATNWAILCGFATLGQVAMLLPCWFLFGAKEKCQTSQTPAASSASTHTTV